MGSPIFFIVPVFTTNCQGCEVKLKERKSLDKLKKKKKFIDKSWLSIRKYNADFLPEGKFLMSHDLAI